MSVKTIDIKCPNCGAGVDTGQKVCVYCKSPVIISTFNSVFDMPLPKINQYANAYRQALAEHPGDRTLNNSAAMCYLKLKLYDKAAAAFERSMEDNFDNSETFFYAAVCLLQGKIAFTAKRSVIDKIEEYINAALMIEPRGIYYYFLAYIKHDYFHRKMFNTAPAWSEALAMSGNAGVPATPFDIERLFAILGVENPFI